MNFTIIYLFKKHHNVFFGNFGGQIANNTKKNAFDYISDIFTPKKSFPLIFEDITPIVPISKI